MLRLPVVGWHRRSSRRQLFYLGSIVIVVITAAICASVWILAQDSQPKNGPKPSGSQTKRSVISTKSAAEPSPPAPAPKPAPPLKSPQFLFGVGTELDHALNHRITREAPIKLLTSWYNSPEDLNFMSGWRNGKVPHAYGAGYSMHLVIYSNDPEQSLDTPYGPACGRPYPVSGQFLSDMRQLAQIFSGGTLYVSMFTELQTYPCADNAWAAGEPYYRTLKDNYLAAMRTFHELAPGSQVSLSWGGWQTNWDDAGQGGGKSIFNHFADVMNVSDFQSFQAMATTGNLSIISNMAAALQPYKGKTMVAHYKPDGGSQSAFDNDMKDIFTNANMAILQQKEVFAFSFMDTENMNSSEIAYQSVKRVVESYGR